MFFAGLPMRGDGRQPFTDREEFLETSGDLYLAVRATLTPHGSRDRTPHRASTKRPASKRVARLRSELEFLLESNANNMVYLDGAPPHGSADRPAALKGHDFSRAETTAKRRGFSP